MIFEGILNILGNGHGIIKHKYIQKKIIVDKNNINFNFNLSKVNFEIIEEELNNIKANIVSNENIINKNVIGIVHHFYKNKALIYCSKIGSKFLINSINEVSNIDNIDKNYYVKVKIVDVCENKIYGEIIEILGDYDNKRAISEYIKFNNNLDDNYSSYNELKEIINNFNNLLNKEKESRVNHINKVTYTIDPEGSKDLDDALNVEEYDDHYKVYIYIADVSSIVKKNSNLYKDALNRSFSNYLPDYVIKMFPSEISEDICSIHENNERLVVTTEIKISKEFEILDYKFYRAIIKSNKQFTYEEVSDIIREDKYDDNYILESLRLMYKIYKNIKKENKLKIPEIKFKKDIEISYLDDIHEMIEEMMILNNRLVAEYLNKENKLFIGRNHEEPKLDKNYDLLKNINNLDGFDMEKINKILNDENNYLLNLFLIQQIMPKARYSLDKDSHWGLDLENYTHFTSPIRRFSDLINHYILFGENFERFELLEIIQKINDNEDKEQNLNYELININRFQNIRINEYVYNEIIMNGIIINISNPRVIVFINELFMSQEMHVSKFSNEILNYDKIKKEFNGNIMLYIGKEVKLKIKKINYCSKIIDLEIISTS